MILIYRLDAQWNSPDRLILAENTKLNKLLSKIYATMSTIFKSLDTQAILWVYELEMHAGLAAREPG